MNRPNNNNNSIHANSMFLGAPFTKLLGGTTGLAYVLVHTKRVAIGLEFDALRMKTNSGESYRYLTSKLTFGSTSELVVGTLLLLYLCRKFEREMGSRKMALFCGFVTIGSIAVESTCFVGPPLALFDLRYTGPYALIGALFSLYHRYTPRLHPRFFSLLGVAFSEKTFHYVWLAQVALSRGWHSAYAVGIGWMMALLFDGLPYVKKIDVPQGLANFFGTHVANRFLEAPPRLLVPARGRGGGGFGAARANQNNNNAANAGAHHRAAPQRPAADPAAVEQLVGMGFSRAQVVEALQSTNNDLQRAANQLLAG